MTTASILAYAVLAALAMATPGPGVAALVARALATGFRGAVPMIGGYVLGDFIYLSLAVTGLALLARSFEAVFLVLKFLGAAYLVLLAVRFWRMPVGEGAATAPRQNRGSMLFLAGLSVTLGNPKVMVFYLAVLPAVIDLAAVTLLDYLLLVALTATILATILSAYAFLAGRVRPLLAGSRARRAVNRGAGAAMFGAALAIAAR